MKRRFLNHGWMALAGSRCSIRRPPRSRLRAIRGLGKQAVSKTPVPAGHGD